MTNVKQMVTQIGRDAMTLDEAGVWIQVGPSLSITTTEPEAESGLVVTEKETRLTALFVAECVGAVRQQFNSYETEDAYLPELDFLHQWHRHPIHRYEPVGTPVEVRITIDGADTLPPITRFVGTATEMASHSFLALRTDVAAGDHIVTVWGRATEAPGAVMRNRTLTVWETVTEKPQEVLPPA